MLNLAAPPRWLASSSSPGLPGIHISDASVELFVAGRFTTSAKLPLTVDSKVIVPVPATAAIAVARGAASPPRSASTTRSMSRGEIVPLPSTSKTSPTLQACRRVRCRPWRSSPSMSNRTSRADATRIADVEPIADSARGSANCQGVGRHEQRHHGDVGQNRIAEQFHRVVVRLFAAGGHAGPRIPAPATLNTTWPPRRAESSSVSKLASGLVSPDPSVEMRATAESTTRAKSPSIGDRM